MDKMTLFKEDGTAIEVEIVMTFKLEKYNNSDYLIYKFDNEYFGAKYIEENDVTRLETNISSEEKIDLSKTFEELTKMGVIQC